MIYLQICRDGCAYAKVGRELISSLEAPNILPYDAEPTKNIRSSITKKSVRLSLHRNNKLWLSIVIVCRKL